MDKEEDKQKKDLPLFLSHSEKIYTLGLMTYGIIHEISNSIQGMLLLINFLKSNNPSDETILSLEEEIHRLKDSAHKTREYFKTNRIHFTAIDLPALISKTINMLAILSTELAFTEIKTQFSDEKLLVKGNYFYLQQAFSNLFLFCHKKHQPNTPIMLQVNEKPEVKKTKIVISFATVKNLQKNEYFNDEKLDLAQKIFHIHQIEFNFSIDSKNITFLCITIPSSLSSQKAS